MKWRVVCGLFSLWLCGFAVAMNIDMGELSFGFG